MLRNGSSTRATTDSRRGGGGGGGGGGSSSHRAKSVLLCTVIALSVWNLLGFWTKNYSNVSSRVTTTATVTPWNKSSNDNTQPPMQHYSILVVVPGNGDVKRLTKLKATLMGLRQSTLNSTTAAVVSVDFACLVYVWNVDLVDHATSELDGLCAVQSNPGGLWTHHMLQVGRKKDHGLNASVSSSSHTMLEQATHVAILMDDVDVGDSVDVPDFLHRMEHARLTVASPTVVAQYAHMAPRPYCQTHETGHVDMLFAVFTKEMWYCWQEMIDLTHNPLGWGYDVALADVCAQTSAKVGIIDSHQLYHDEANATTGNPRLYNSTMAHAQMDAWLTTQSSRVPSLTDNDWNATRYFKHVTKERPRTMPYCRTVAFDIQPWRQQPHHNDDGGNTTTVTTVLLDRLVQHDPETFIDSTRTSSITHSLPRTHDGTILLIPSVNDWFRSFNSSSQPGLPNEMNGQPVLDKPWVGFVEGPVSPATIHNRNTGNSHFGNVTTFTAKPRLDWISSWKSAAASNCVALFVYTSGLQTLVQQQLTELSATSNTSFNHVKVCLVRHPFRNLAAIATSDSPFATDSMDPIPFDPTVDLRLALSTKTTRATVASGRALPIGALLQLQEPFHRLESLHSLQTQRQKVYLLDRSDDTSQTNAVQEEQEINNNNVLSTIRIDRIARPHEFSQLVRQNIVFVDGRADDVGVFTAALIALEYQAPLIIRQQEGYADYLGADYPLFFTSLDQVQELLDNPHLLHDKMTLAHWYLKLRVRQQQQQQQESWTLSHLSRQMVDCTIEALARRGFDAPERNATVTE